MRTRMIDGELHCLVSESGPQTLWQQCSTAPLQMSVGQSFDADVMVGGLGIIACGCVLFLWLSSVAEARRRRYQSLITAARRSLKG